MKRYLFAFAAAAMMVVGVVGGTSAAADWPPGPTADGVGVPQITADGIGVPQVTVGANAPENIIAI
jgi:hypothetical protein